MINKLRLVQQKETNLFPHGNKHGYGNLMEAVESFQRAAKYEFEIVKIDEQEKEDRALEIIKGDLPVIC